MIIVYCFDKIFLQLIFDKKIFLRKIVIRIRLDEIRWYSIISVFVSQIERYQAC